MKLTKIHIFLILLLALVLCSTLGMCSNEGIEGFSNRSDDKRTYNSYLDYIIEKSREYKQIQIEADFLKTNILMLCFIAQYQVVEG